MTEVDLPAELRAWRVIVFYEHPETADDARARLAKWLAELRKAGRIA